MKIKKGIKDQIKKESLQVNNYKDLKIIDKPTKEQKKDEVLFNIVLILLIYNFDNIININKWILNINKKSKKNNNYANKLSLIKIGKKLEILSKN